MRSARVCLAAGLTLGLTLFVAACGHELATQPTSSLTPPPPPTSSLTASFSRDDAPASDNATFKVTFTIKPFDDNYIVIGPHLLTIPAGSVCDPATSDYGDGTWDHPCAAVKHSITVTATATTRAGHPLVEFDTHLRFKPVQNYDRGAVMLYLHDNHATSASTITWCPSANSTCIDEAKGSTNVVQLKTWFDAGGAWVYRKIQHFSGYNVTGGDKGTDPSAGM